jgi:tetratricopeptide (TPR) repeat protein
VERLALHSFRGQQWDRAVGFLRQAGEKAALRSAYHEAGAYIEQALVALGHLPESEEALRRGVDLRFKLRSALQALGQHERVLGHLREAEKLASKLEDQDRIGWASAYLAQYLWRMGDPGQAEALGQRAREIALRLGDSSLEAIANFFLGQGYFNVGNYRRSIDYCRRNVDLLKGQQAYERLGLTGLPSVLSRVWLSWSFAERGEFADAMSFATEALAIAEAAGQHYSVAAACLCMGQIQVDKGGHAGAIQMLERAAELCKTWDLGVISPTVTAVLSLAYASCGRVADGLPALEQSEALAPEVRIFDTPTARSSLGAVYLLAGKLDQAAGVATRSAELSVQLGFRGSEAEASRLLGEICAQRESPDVDRVGGHYRRGLELANDLGMRPLAAHCHLGIGALSGRTEQQGLAREHLGTAIEMYREMAMSSYLTRAEEALRTFV